MEQINHANGEASAMLAVAEARAQGLNIVSQSLKVQVSSRNRPYNTFLTTQYSTHTPQEGKSAASLFIAEEYVHAFNKLARTNNTLILPANVGDVNSLVGHAMSIFNTVSSHNANANAAASLESCSIDGPQLGTQTAYSESASNQRKDTTLLMNEASSDQKFDTKHKRDD